MEPSTSPWTPTWRLTRRRTSLPTGVQLAYAELPPKAPETARATTAGSDAAAQHTPTIVLLHGLTNDADAWAEAAEVLQRLLPDIRIVIPDLRGHGESGLPDDGRWHDDPVASMTMPELAADVVALMDALSIKHATIAGHSMGSLVATEVALAHPHRVRGTVLVSTTGDAAGTPFLSDWLRVDVIERTWRAALEARGVQWPSQAMALTPLDVDPNAVAWMQQYWNVYPFTPGRSTLEFAERAARLPLATWLGATQGILDTDRLAALPSLRPPVCALWATQDSFFRTDDQQALIGALREAVGEGGSFVWKQYGHRPLAADGLQTDDLGHNLTWDAPAQVATDIAAFWRTGAPTDTWFQSGAPDEPHTIVEAPDAPVVSAGD